jgi:hypothetical protein
MIGVDQLYFDIFIIFLYNYLVSIFIYFNRGGGNITNYLSETNISGSVFSDILGIKSFLFISYSVFWGLRKWVVCFLGFSMQLPITDSKCILTST